MTDYLVYDVFTDTPFTGNQLAIIPKAQTIPESRLQLIAREFNFSETVFVYPPDDASHTAKLRIFTPTMEVPFAGHPTIGTAVALHALGAPADLVLELGIGPVSCTVEGQVARFTTTAPLEILAHPERALVASALGLDESDIAVTPPIVQASLGLPFVFVSVTSRQALSRIETSIDVFQQGANAYPTEFDFAIYAYFKEGQAVHARMFAPLDNIPEDPATGSAAATLGAILSQETPQELQISQGEDMGRPSMIMISTKQDGSVSVAGQAVQTMEGRLIAKPTI